MKILIASTLAAGHISPMLAITRILLDDDHEIAFLTGTAFRDRIEASGAQFLPLPANADFDGRDLPSPIPELKDIPPGSQWLRIVCERLFVDAIPAQDRGLREALKHFQADVIVGDDLLFGVLPMLLGPREMRPPIVLCGTSFLHWKRDDGAPDFVGLPPATTKDQREQYAVLAGERDANVNQPVLRKLNEVLKTYGVGPVSVPLFHSVVSLADAYLQLSVPGLEFPRELPPTVHFVGTPPIIRNQAPLPPWAHELDGSRKVVLVTQGTVTNHNFGLLLAPTLAALANEPDLLVVATAGGRPIETIPGPIPSNARLASYLPFEWLLPRVDALVTNGGYGTVNQALSFGIPLVTAGLIEDKADVNARVAWSGVGINLATNAPTSEALREATRTVLDRPSYRMRATQMADEFASIDTRSEVVRTIRRLESQRRAQPRAATMKPARSRRAAR
ncbi:glycosyltransferase [Bradyrhizobium sp. I71]|uniref:glycosyltransferase n=1 Tax=Bradyrhizobium sp. I71 TaxID=2590772 RepID=UPI001EF844A0|nr:glycosyltransferase [Bradyrhizobium sp. I71]ULL01791.1 glycosyltransferase family 1 protein [Bradyrhizobium sp. I71]